MNIIVIKGRLTAAPEVKKTSNGTSVCRFTVAVDRRYGIAEGEKPTDFIPCTAWKGTAEFLGRYFTKGQEILISGSLQSDKYQDKDGNNRTSYAVNVDNIEFCGKREAKPDPTESNTEDTGTVPDGIDDDDLPF